MSSVSNVFVAQKHLRVRRSGVSGNNLGGVMFTEEIPETALHNAFPEVTEQEAKNGVRDHVGLYLLNIHPTVTAKGLVMFSPGTQFTNTDIRFAIDPQGVGDGLTFGVGQTIPNKTTSPIGVSWKNGAGRSSENALVIPDLPPNRAILLWFERFISFNSPPGEDDNMQIIIDTNNIIGDLGSTGGLTDVQGIVITGQTEVSPELDQLNTVTETEAAVTNYMFLGNTSNDDDATSWIRNIGKHYQKDLVKFCFGKNDIKSMTKRNQIVNGLDTAASAGYQNHIANNIAFIMLDTSGFQAYKNPSTQYNRIVQFLENANRNPNIDFIVVLMGTPMYATLPNNDPDPDIKIDTEARKTYHQLFTKYGVHLVIGSGINNYQRHHVLGYNEVSPDSPSLFFTGDAPNYKIALKQKNFGATGSLYLSVGSGVKLPKHNLPEPHKPYMAFGYIPQGVGYLKLLSRRRTTTTPAILEGRYYDYYLPPTGTTTTALNSRVKLLVDKFTIQYTLEPT